MALRQVHLAGSATSVTRPPVTCRTFGFSYFALPGLIGLTITSRKNSANYRYFRQDHEIATSRQWLTLKQTEKPETVFRLFGGSLQQMN
jgi:hypothetical protein